MDNNEGVKQNNEENIENKEFAAKTEAKIKFPGLAESLNAHLDRIGAPPKFKGRVEFVAARYKVSASAARKWLTGLCAPEDFKKFQICDDLGCSLDELVLGRAGSHDKNQSNRFREILSDYSGKNNEQKQIGITYLTASSEMSPIINPGDLVTIDDTQNTLEDNAIFAFARKGEQGFRIRKVTIDIDNSIVLRGENSLYETIRIQRDSIKEAGEIDESWNGLYVVGKAISVMRKF